MHRPIQLTKTTSFRGTSLVTRRKKLHSLIAGLQPAAAILAGRIAIPLLLLTVGMVVVQPCAGQSGTWATTGSLTTARVSHTETLLPNGKVLVGGGFDSDGTALASAELYDPASGSWMATGSQATGRYYHTATLLPNGKVLVAGGASGSALASAELYDPVGGTWAVTGSLGNARTAHTATLLPDGKVLVAGGVGNSRVLARAELYDPVGGTWTATRSLATARSAHTAVLLPGGKVLVVGGRDRQFNTLASAELYDPARGAWTAAGSLATARYSHTATLLPNGKVLVAGGLYFNNALATAELYDPASGTWSVTGSLATARYSHTATLLPDGKVLVAGGSDINGGSLASAELYTSDGGDIVLQARLKAQGNKHQVQLQWSPADGGDMNILRNGAVVATTPDDGQAPSNLGTHTGTFTYQVCETDSGDCSNEVTVVVP
jgi:N-acetylneuraminic acid mutarotase